MCYSLEQVVSWQPVFYAVSPQLKRPYEQDYLDSRGTNAKHCPQTLALAEELE